MMQAEKEQNHSTGERQGLRACRRTKSRFATPATRCRCSCPCFTLCWKDYLEEQRKNAAAT